MGPTNWFRTHLSSNNNNNKQQDQTASPQPPAYEQSTSTTPAAAAPTAQAQPKQPPSDHPTIIEVFQSQGCNSCPPTNSLLLSKMAQEDPNTLILDYHVTYWDRLGWTDPFGIPQADEYQREYAHAKGTSRVYTPQVVVNGVAEGVGNTKNSLESLIAEGERKARERSLAPWLEFAQTPQGIVISQSESSASASSVVGAASMHRRQGRIIEVLYDPAPKQVYIPRGENAHRTLVQRNTVKSVKDLGTWTDGQGPLRLPPRDASDGLQRVLIVQEGRGGPVIGVSRIYF